jgi:hypothetical protein
MLCSVQRCFPAGLSSSCDNLTLKINNRKPLSRPRDPTHLKWAPSLCQETKRSKRPPSIFFMGGGNLKEVCHTHASDQANRDQHHYISSEKGTQKQLDMDFKIKCTHRTEIWRHSLGQLGEHISVFIFFHIENQDTQAYKRMLLLLFLFV